MLDEKELRERPIKFWEVMVGISVLIFTAYTVLKDFSTNNSMALQRSVFFVFILMIFLIVYYLIMKQRISDKSKQPDLERETMVDEYRSCIDKKELDKKVIAAMKFFDKYNKPINFRNELMTIEDCRYIQKHAEINRSYYEVLLGIGPFIFALGTGFSTQNVSNINSAYNIIGIFLILAGLGVYTKGHKWLLYVLFLNVLGTYFLILNALTINYIIILIMIIFGSVLYIYARQIFSRCQGTTLHAEEGILIRENKERSSTSNKEYN